MQAFFLVCGCSEGQKLVQAEGLRLNTSSRNNPLVVFTLFALVYKNLQNIQGNFLKTQTHIC